jgi:hypothetical protein
MDRLTPDQARKVHDPLGPATGYLWRLVNRMCETDLRVRDPELYRLVTTVADPEPAVDGAGVWLDFAHLKRQLPMGRVLDHLGLTPRLKGSGAQRRCACPIHRGDGRGRTFSVNLEANVYQCFDARCGSAGDVIDLWAALSQRDVRSAALDLVHGFGLEPNPPGGTEKRNG